MLAALCLSAAASVRALHPPAPPSPDSTLSPRAVHLVGLGRDTAVATGIWMRTVDRHVAGTATPTQVAESIRVIGELDPTWVEPWFFGILMLPEPERELRLQLLDEAAALHDGVPWFAWRAGMSRLGDDRTVALEWLRRAAEAPGADPAYAQLLAALEDQD